MDLIPFQQSQSRLMVMTLPKNMKTGELNLLHPQDLKWAFIVCYQERPVQTGRMILPRLWKTVGYRGGKLPVSIWHSMILKDGLMQLIADDTSNQVKLNAAHGNIRQREILGVGDNRNIAEKWHQRFMFVYTTKTRSKAYRDFVHALKSGSKDENPTKPQGSIYALRIVGDLYSALSVFQRGGHGMRYLRPHLLKCLLIRWQVDVLDGY